MPELRKDPIIGRWVIIATERARRPGNFVERLAHVHMDFSDSARSDGEEETLYEYTNAEQGWAVRVVDSESPILSQKEPFSPKPHGIYEKANGYGVHEVVLETQEPIRNMADLEIPQIEASITAYAERLKVLSEDPNLQYGYIYKNYHLPVNGSVQPSSSMVIASPVIPLHIQEKIDGAIDYYKENNRRIFTDLIEQEKTEGKNLRIVVENEHYVAVIPFAPRFLFETWILPKKHHSSFMEGIQGTQSALAELLKDILTRFKIGLDEPAYTFVLNTSPFRQSGCGTEEWEMVDKAYSWHIELAPHLTHVAGFEIGTGFYICSVPPEYAAEYLRGVTIE